MRIKTSYAEYYRAIGNERLTREVLELLSRLEQIAQARYAGGLVPQQDAIRAQVEQTGMRLELVGFENETRQSRARLNGLLGRDAAAPLADPQELQPRPAVSPVDAATLAERARAKKLSVDDVQGGTFTITNPGIFGSLFGTPIINQPQVGILGVGAAIRTGIDYARTNQFDVVAILSGDDHLLSLRVSVPVYSPAEFLELLERTSS
jgi:hypothetical protein